MASASDLSQPRITDICDAGLLFIPPLFGGIAKIKGCPDRTALKSRYGRCG